MGAVYTVNEVCRDVDVASASYEVPSRQLMWH